MKKPATISDLLGEAFVTFTELRRVPDGGEGHTAAQETEIGDKRAKKLLKGLNVCIHDVTMLRAVGLTTIAANLAACGSGVAIDSHFIARSATVHHVDGVSYSDIQKAFTCGDVAPWLTAGQYSPDIEKFLVAACVLAARIRGEIQHVAARGIVPAEREGGV